MGNMYAWIRTQLDVALHGEEDVVGLDVAMYHALRV
jgi:hypothetical protein